VAWTETQEKHGKRRRRKILENVHFEDQEYGDFLKASNIAARKICDTLCFVVHVAIFAIVLVSVPIKHNKIYVQFLIQSIMLYPELRRQIQ